MKTMMGIALIAVAVAALVSGASAQSAPVDPELCFVEGWKSTSLSFHLPRTHPTPETRIHPLPRSSRARAYPKGVWVKHQHRHHALRAYMCLYICGVKMCIHACVCAKYICMLGGT